jgi:multidrug efflux pump subunit AcrB
MVNFFIDRPIFPWVIAIVIMLAGGLSILSLPIAQYPAIAPPLISISVAYPGASAETVQSTVVQVIEQQLSGLDHLRYFSSASTKDGNMEIALTFEQGTDPDTAQVQVQNKLSLAEPLLPIEVQQQGIRVTKGTRNFLSTAWGSSYVNQFIDGGRVKRVFVQGDAPYRMRPEDVGRCNVRNGKGDTAPFSAFASGHWTHGPPKLERYNGISSMEILGQPAAAYSTGEAMQEMERLIAQLPTGLGHEWTGLSYEERLSGGQAPALYALSLLVVFLYLAALYESWAIPVSVMLVVPLGVIGAVLGALLRGFDNGVYFQVALVTTVGLSAKNAILIVEFAKANVEQGMGLIEAGVNAAQQRLRPILMTSLAFMFGVLPLAISSGAGSGAQNAVGTGVVGGTLSATALGIFFVPMFFVVVRSLFKPRRLGQVAKPSTAEAH